MANPTALMSPDSGVQRRFYPKSGDDMQTKQTSMRTETDRISGGPTTPDTAGGYGPTGSDRVYPRGRRINMSADFLGRGTDPTDLYVGGVGPSE